MKKLLSIIVLLIATATTARAEVEFGNVAIGADFVYGSHLEGPGMGVKLRSDLIAGLRGEVSAHHFFKKHGLYMWDVNADLQYQIPLSGQASLFTVTGLAVLMQDGNNADSQTKLGVNVGGGLEYDITAHLSLNMGVKYTFASHLHQWVVGPSVIYHF